MIQGMVRGGVTEKEQKFEEGQRVSQSPEERASQAEGRERAKTLSGSVPRVFQEQPHFEFKVYFKARC